MTSSAWGLNTICLKKKKKSFCWEQKTTRCRGFFPPQIEPWALEVLSVDSVKKKSRSVRAQSDANSLWHESETSVKLVLWGFPRCWSSDTALVVFVLQSGLKTKQSCPETTTAAGCSCQRSGLCVPVSLSLSPCKAMSLQSQPRQTGWRDERRRGWKIDDRMNKEERSEQLCDLLKLFIPLDPSVRETRTLNLKTAAVSGESWGWRGTDLTNETLSFTESDPALAARRVCLFQRRAAATALQRRKNQTSLLVLINKANKTEGQTSGRGGFRGSDSRQQSKQQKTQEWSSNG